MRFLLLAALTATAYGCGTIPNCADCVADANVCVAAAVGYWLDTGVPTACGGIPNCGTLNCTAADDQTCAAAAPGYWLDTGVPTACGGIPNCGTVSCTAADDQTCAAAAAGYWLDTGVPTACGGIPNCGTIGCTAADDQTCVAAAPGYWLDTGVPTACGAIPNCGTLSCTAADDQTCAAAAAGYWLDTGVPTACGGIPNCGTINCTAADDQTCAAAAAGYWLDTGVPTQCGGIPNCAAVNCSAADDQVCGTAAAGYWLDTGVPTACGGIPNCATLNCTAADDQTCAAAAAGYWLDTGVPTACTAIDGCTNVLCTAADDQTCDDEEEACAIPNCGTCAGDTCSAAAAGFWLDTGVPTACGAIEFCVSVTCTAADDSVCTAADAEHYLDTGVITACPAIPNCASLTCTTADDVACHAASPGHWLDTGVPTACGAIPNCATTNCTAADDQTCAGAAEGFWLDTGVPTACTPIDGCTHPICTSAADETCNDAAHLIGCAVPAFGTNVAAGPIAPCNPDAGTCSDASYTSQSDCETNSGTWTPTLMANGAACDIGCANGFYMSSGTYNVYVCSTDADNFTGTNGIAADIVCENTCEQIEDPYRPGSPCVDISCDLADGANPVCNDEEPGCRIESWMFGGQCQPTAEGADPATCNYVLPSTRTSEAKCNAAEGCNWIDNPRVVAGNTAGCEVDTLLPHGAACDVKCGTGYWASAGAMTFWVCSMDTEDFDGSQGAYADLACDNVCPTTNEDGSVILGEDGNPCDAVLCKQEDGTGGYCERDYNPDAHLDNCAKGHNARFNDLDYDMDCANGCDFCNENCLQYIPCAEAYCHGMAAIASILDIPTEWLQEHCDTEFNDDGTSPCDGCQTCQTVCQGWQPSWLESIEKPADDFDFDDDGVPDGFYDDENNSRQQCTPVPGCTEGEGIGKVGWGSDCTNEQGQAGTSYCIPQKNACVAGYFWGESEAGGTCTSCTPIVDCAEGQLICTDSTDSICKECTSLDNGCEVEACSVGQNRREDGLKCVDIPCPANSQLSGDHCICDDTHLFEPEQGNRAGAYRVEWGVRECTAADVDRKVMPSGNTEWIGSCIPKPEPATHCVTGEYMWEGVCYACDEGIPGDTKEEREFFLKLYGWESWVPWAPEGPGSFCELTCGEYWDTVDDDHMCIGLRCYSALDDTGSCPDGEVCSHALVSGDASGVYSDDCGFSKSPYHQDCYIICDSPGWVMAEARGTIGLYCDGDGVVSGDLPTCIEGYCTEWEQVKTNNCMSCPKGRKRAAPLSMTGEDTPCDILIDNNDADKYDRTIPDDIGQNVVAKCAMGYVGSASWSTQGWNGCSEWTFPVAACQYIFDQHLTTIDFDSVKCGTQGGSCEQDPDPTACDALYNGYRDGCTTAADAGGVSKAAVGARSHNKLVIDATGALENYDPIARFHGFADLEVWGFTAEAVAGFDSRFDWEKAPHSSNYGYARFTADGVPITAEKASELWFRDMIALFTTIDEAKIDEAAALANAAFAADDATALKSVLLIGADTPAEEEEEEGDECDGELDVDGTCCETGLDADLNCCEEGVDEDGQCVAKKSDAKTLVRNSFVAVVAGAMAILL